MNTESTLREESVKEVEHLGKRLRAGLWCWKEGGKTKKEAFCYIHDLSPRCPLLNVQDDNGEPLRGVSHAIEAGKSIIDTVHKYGWGTTETT